jgi:hypothetical protein
MQLRDPETATKVLGVTELNGDTTYNFYSVDGKQTLNVTIHPGDGHSIISIFRVRYTNGPIRKAAQLAIRSFKTEKNIELGLAKNELIQRLGKCYSIGDSSKNFIEIQYRLESPQDSKTKLLERQNMPIYYADYKFKNERLIDYEFGFEYP